MAIIYWRLGHLTADQSRRPLGPFLVFQGDRVFDVDVVGWDMGIRAGDPVAEMKWRYPQAVMIPWHPARYRTTEHALRQWLQEKAVAFQQPEVRQGWWEWPRMTAKAYHRLMEEIIPRWAGRIEAGVARHVLLAKWIMMEGERLKLPVWASSSWKTYVLSPAQEGRFWPQLPLKYIPGVSEKIRRAWAAQGWRVAGDVPGLIDRLHQPWLGDTPSPFLQVVRVLDDPLVRGIGDLMRDMAEELANELSLRGLGFSRLEILWKGEAAEGIQHREREWPEAKADRTSILARSLSLLRVPPPFAPHYARLRALKLVPYGLEQLNWWGTSRPKSTHTLPDASPLALNRREMLLQYWDIWRMSRVAP